MDDEYINADRKVFETADRDTALVISAMFALKLSECGSSVDYEIPWGIPHSGDYDLEELFDYIDKM